MRFVAAGLFAEGSSDHRALQPILRRLLEHSCLLHSDETVEIPNIVTLRTPQASRARPRERRIRDAAEGALGVIQVLFVHTDGNGDAAAALSERVDPARRLVVELGELAPVVVPVVPARESEAWLLADGDCLREVFGSRRTDSELGIPSRPRDVERIPDPKRVLEQALSVARPNRSPRDRAIGYFDLIGERIPLSTLREVPSFASLEEDLVRALRELRVIH
jgi:hypothetical protein